MARTPLASRIVRPALKAALGVGLALGCGSKHQLDLFAEEPAKPEKPMEPKAGEKPEPQCPKPEPTTTEGQMPEPPSAEPPPSDPKDEDKCTTDAECPKELPACAEGLCVVCGLDEHCPTDQVCNGALHACTHACDETLQCEKATLCDPERGYCVECRAEPDCPKDRPACEPETGTCVQCTSDAHCGDPKRSHCDASTQKCAAVSTAASCDGGPCEVAPSCSN